MAFKSQREEEFQEGGNKQSAVLRVAEARAGRWPEKPGGHDKHRFRVVGQVEVWWGGCRRDHEVTGLKT